MCVYICKLIKKQASSICVDGKDKKKKRKKENLPDSEVYRSCLMYLNS